jgi:hypothetical protein
MNRLPWLKIKAFFFENMIRYLQLYSGGRSMKSFRDLLVFFLIFAMPVCGMAATYPLHLQYRPAKDFSSLPEKMGSNLAMAPFKDERSETLFIGVHTPLMGSASYFRSDPSPLERAIQESLLGPLFQHGVKTVPIPDWDGQPESLKELETDSVLMIQIKRFWIEGTGAPFRTSVKTSVHFVIHLGVKKEGKVFLKNVEVEKETTLPRLTPEGMEKILNGILTDIFDSFFSNPY